MCGKDDIFGFQRRRATHQQRYWNHNDCGQCSEDLEGLTALPFFLSLRAAINRVDPNLPLYFIGTPKTQLDGALSGNRIIAVIERAMSGFAAASAAFDPYRTWITGHEQVFAGEVEALFPRPGTKILTNRQERREAARARPVRPPMNGRKPAQRKKSAHR